MVWLLKHLGKKQNSEKNQTGGEEWEGLAGDKPQECGLI